MPIFTGQVAIVTGASSGIGRAAALAFAQEGARVAVGDVAVEGGEQTVQLIRERGGSALFYECDVAKAADAAELVRRTVDAFGRLDFAFNNAGIEGATAPTAECSEQNWDKTVAVNLRGVWLSMKYEIPRMLEQGGGVIVNCSSIAGLVGFANRPAYVASKHGVIGLTRAAALEYASSGLRINAICPGVIRTPMLERVLREHPEMETQLATAAPMRRIGTAEEIATTVVWLCSKSASFITGQAIAADGGWVAQ